MGQAATKLTELAETTEKHALVARLTDGLVIYSKDFWKDFWLYFKNNHIVVSCWAVHPEHYFTRSERFWVVMVSLFVAFGLSGIGALMDESEGSKDRSSCQCLDQGRKNYPVDRITIDGQQECPDGAWCDPGQKEIERLLVISVVSVIIQTFYDKLSAMVVTCGCVQTGCPVIVKTCLEGLGKCAFAILFMIGCIFLGLGSAYPQGQTGHAWLVKFCMFLATKLVVFFVSGSLTLLVMFYLARRSQMKPSEDELRGNSAVQLAWESDGCCSSAPPCELWNKYIGEDKFYCDLPDEAPDYDYEFRVGCFCAVYSLYRHTATNTIEAMMVNSAASDPQAWTASPAAPYVSAPAMVPAMYAAPAAEQPAPMPNVTVCQPQAAAAPGTVDGWAMPSPQPMPPPVSSPAADDGDTVDTTLPAGWVELQDADGRTYYQNDHDKTTQWERPTAPVSSPAADDGDAVDTTLPAGWVELQDADGRTYYQNDNAKTTQWERPT